MSAEKKVLVTGTSGMLGGNFVYEMAGKYEIHGVYRSVPNTQLKKQFQADLSDINKVRDILYAANPDIILHCAALTDVERCEQDYYLAHSNNAAVVKNLLSVFRPASRFIFISTDSVFDGKRGHYNESDLPSPLNNYAKSKLEGERFIEQMSDNYCIIRTNIFGWNRVSGESFAEWILNNLSRNNPIGMFYDVIFSPITANTLSEFIEKLLDAEFVGRLNIASDSAISKYNFGVKLSERFRFNSELISPVSLGSFGFKAKRPENTSLDVGKAYELFGRLPTVDEEIEVFYRKRIKFL